MDVSALAPFANADCPTCGASMRVKCEFGPYTLDRLHAVGGMSMVFTATDNTLGREVALKILSEEFSSDEQRIKAFGEEARITASFTHPNVVRVLTTGKSFGRFYIAMELVPGGHFEHHIRERGKIPEAEMLPLAIEVAQGLKAAHAAGLIHRDVKPGNILLDAGGHAKLVDFGLALVTQGGKAQATEVWATPYYVPPETIEGGVEDFRSDIYAFGATLYHALTGKPSCGEETMATDVLREAKKKVLPLALVEPSLSPDICRIVDRALSYDPAGRFSSYDEMIALLESAMQRVKSHQPAAPEVSGKAARRAAKKRRGEWIGWIAAGTFLLVAIVSGAFWMPRRDAPEDGLKAPASGATALVPEVESHPGTGVAAAIASDVGSDIGRYYREARAAVEARDFAKAAIGFVSLRENPAVQEPTRSWAGVEAVACTYLDGQSARAAREAQAALAHIRSVPEGQRIGDDGLTRLLEKLSDLPAIPAKSSDASSVDRSPVISLVLAGLKNWEQGMPDQAVGYFSAAVSGKISADEAWMGIYQVIARDYLSDYRELRAAVFENLPAEPAGCDAAVSELDALLTRLKTRGRARYNVRAWQLDIVKHSKRLADSKVSPTDVPATQSVAPD
jgi:hypothetical protein